MDLDTTHGFRTYDRDHRLPLGHSPSPSLDGYNNYRNNNVNFNNIGRRTPPSSKRHIGEGFDPWPIGMTGQYRDGMFDGRDQALSGSGLNQRYYRGRMHRPNPLLEHSGHDPENEKDSLQSTSGRTKTFTGVISDFADVTSIQGIPFIKKTSRWWSKLLWTLCFLAATGVGIWQTSELVVKYLNWEYNVAIDLQFERLEFPSVTFCNLNPVRKSLIENDLALSELSAFVTERGNNIPTEIRRPGEGGQGQQPQRPQGPSQGQPHLQPGQQGQPQGQTPPQQAQPPQQQTQLPQQPEQQTQEADQQTQQPEQQTQQPQDAGNNTLQAGNNTQQLPRPNTPRRQKRQIGILGKGGPGGKPPTPQDSGHVYKLSDEVSDEEQIRLDFKRLYSNLTRKVREEASHQPQHFIVQCSFAGTKCSYQNFSQWLSPEYGMCFTFNSPDTMDVPLRSYTSGKSQGLIVVLYIQEKEYLSQINSATGAVLSVNSYGTRATPDVNGLSISPGQETLFGIRLTNITRLGLPYANCSDDSYFEDYDDLRYTQEMCIYVCPHRQIVKKCGCYMSPYENAYPRQTVEKFPSCAVFEETYDCATRIIEDLVVQSNPCDCFPPCAQQDFTVLSSSNQWPHKAYQIGLLQATCEQSPELCDELLTVTPSEYVPSNFMRVRVFYQQLNFQTITQSPSYLPLDLASDFGGTLGLYIGVSFLTVVELVDLLFIMVKLCCRKCCSDGRKERYNGPRH